MAGKSPFWSFGLPFTLTVLSGFLVLAKVRSGRYSVQAQAAQTQRRTKRQLNPLAEDIEDMEEKTHIMDDYEMVPVVASREA